MIEIPGYDVKSELKSGGMGKVYKAEQVMAGNRAVAIKVIKPDLVDDPDFRKRFLAEAGCAVLDHPNIVRVYDVGDKADQLYIAMEFLPGGDLAQKIKAGVSEREALSILRQIAEALKCAHAKNLVHRDVKPANVMFRGDGTVVLTDFGIVKVTTGEKTMTEAGLMVGSPYYMSPEQADSKRVDHRSDLYSLGVMFYEMLARERPYTADRPLSVLFKHIHAPVPTLPAPWEKYQWLIDRLMAKRAEDRYPSAAALLEELDRGGRLKSAPPPPTPAPDVAVPTRTKWAGFALGAAIAAVAGSAYWILTEPEPMQSAEFNTTTSSAPWETVSANTTSSSAKEKASTFPALLPSPSPSTPSAAPVVPAETVIARIQENPPPVRDGEIAVTTDPPGATIRMNGVAQGVSPLRIKSAPGVVTLVAQNDGYELTEEKVAVRSDATTNIVFTLTAIPKIGRLEVQSDPADATWYLDGAAVSLANGSAKEVSPGRYRVEVKKPGFQTWSHEVDVAAGKTVSLQPQLRVNPPPVAPPSVTPPPASIAPPAPPPPKEVPKPKRNESFSF